MAMIPTYQDMLAQALQQSQQQQVQPQSTQNRSIFDNPAFGNSLMKMGLTMLADSEQGYSLGESIGRGGLAFMQERKSQEEMQRQAMLDQQQRQLQEAQLARAQLQDNLNKLALQREAMQYDTAAQQVQNLPPEYQGLAAIDPLATVKLAATNAFNRQDAEREFAQKVQLQNMQYGQQRSLAEEQAQRAFALEQYKKQAQREQAQNLLGLNVGVTPTTGEKQTQIPPYLQKAASLAAIGDLPGAINAKAAAEEEKMAAEKQVRGLSEQSQSIENIIKDTKNLLVGKNYGYTLNTGLVQALPNVFLGTEQQQLANNLESIKSNTTLQQLVAAKQSGVTFGALSEGELNTVATAIAKLDPKNTPTVINNALGTIQKTFDKIAKNTQQDYSKRFGDLLKFNSETGKVE